MIGGAVELRSIAEVVTSTGSLQCRFEDGATAEVPGILARFLQRGDQLRFLGARTEILIQRPTGRRCQQVLHATIGYVGLPKPGRNGEAFVRAELPNCPDGPKALFLSGGALRRYFYLLDGDEPQSLYRLLRVSDIGEYPPPTNYYFAASKGLGLKLKKLLTKPEELKKAVVTNWDKHCKKKITDTKELPLEGTLLEYLNKFDFALRHTLGDRARQSIVDAIFADAKAGNVPHQWEVKEGFECGKNNDCSKESPDKTCKRDTSTDTCYSW